MKINSPNFSTTSFSSSRRTKYKILDSEKIITSKYYSIDPAYSMMVLCHNPNYAPVRVLNSNYTDFFRDDISWLNTAQTLGEIFKDSDKVNVYNFACSDGSEPYTLAMSLIETLGDEAEKFFPIKAYDIDDTIIRKAKSGAIECSYDDVKRINKYTNGKFNEYFENKLIGSDGIIVQPTATLKDNVQFYKRNFLTELPKIKTSNNVILCRNFWRYLPEEKIGDALVAMRHLDAATTGYMFGAFDYNCSEVLPYVFRNAGLKNRKFGVYKIEEEALKRFSDQEILNEAQLGVYTDD